MTSKLRTPIAAGLVALAASAHALEPNEAAAVPQGGRAMPVKAAAWDAAPVATSRLSTLRGGTSVSANVAQDGSVQNASASNLTTGANNVGGGSFANASGLPTVIQNSGANVVIQNSTVVNVLFRP